ncbi:MAG: hypothetical protein UX73_C0018G0011 [candidate division WWE3 bacterium GW2011_GWC1_47_10]|uniref:SpoVT-AbrB domain-containing protein n=1 Tax=candidate division WWE3 bacterium GW2011_GWC1_47_10 TaxID=1619122 RepID=A0A0G1TZ47_UNCKA|nr:MAG: hypothetical protein UX73_C0018G0011 [candidate division WWE3 bacterium GW2011_GWC1_47_10]
MAQKVFEIGNSVAVSIPKSSGIKAGTKVKYSRQGKKLIYEIVDNTALSPAEKHIRETSGTFKIRVKNMNQILKYLKENPYDKTVRLS